MYAVVQHSQSHKQTPCDLSSFVVIVYRSILDFVYVVKDTTPSTSVNRRMYHINTQGLVI